MRWEQELWVQTASTRIFFSFTFSLTPCPFAFYPYLNIRIPFIRRYSLALTFSHFYSFFFFTLLFVLALKSKSHVAFQMSSQSIHSHVLFMYVCMYVSRSYPNYSMCQFLNLQLNLQLRMRLILQLNLQPTQFYN